MVEVVESRCRSITQDGRSPTGGAGRQRRRHSGCRALRRMGEVGSLQRACLRARMRPHRVGEIQMPAQRGTRLTGAADFAAGPEPNTPAAPSASWTFQAVIWSGCASYCSANSAYVFARLRAANTTLAVTAGRCVRRARLVMVSPIRAILAAVGQIFHSSTCPNLPGHDLAADGPQVHEDGARANADRGRWLPSRPYSNARPTRRSRGQGSQHHGIEE